MAIVIITTILPLSVFAQSEKAVAPAKTDSVKKLAQQIQNPANDPFNYVSNTLKSTENYPSAFDLRNVDTNGDGIGDKNYVTPVKFQNPFGTCWGFAAIAAAEDAADLRMAKSSRSSTAISRRALASSAEFLLDCSACFGSPEAPQTDTQRPAQKPMTAPTRININFSFICFPRKSMPLLSL